MEGKMEMKEDHEENSGKAHAPSLVAGIANNVLLYNWYLIRVVDGCIENGTSPNGMRVAVGGCTSPDLPDIERFKSAPIKSRQEKYELRMADGLTVFLMGAIDRQCTYNNGFPFHVIEKFLYGFPRDWNLIINCCFGQPSFETSRPVACLMNESASKQKDSAASEFPEKRMGMSTSGNLDLQASIHYLSSLISPRKSVARCNKRVRGERQPTVSEPAWLPSFATSHEFSKCLESQVNGDSVQKEKCIPRTSSFQNVKGQEQTPGRPLACPMNKSANKEKDRAAPAEFTEKQMGMSSIGNLNLQESIHDLPNIFSPRESVTRCNKRVRDEPQPMVSRLSEHVQLPSFARSHEFSKCSESKISGDSVQKERHIPRSSIFQNVKGDEQNQDQFCGAGLMESARTDKIEAFNGKGQNNGNFRSREIAGFNLRSRHCAGKLNAKRKGRSKSSSGFRNRSPKVSRVLLFDEFSTKDFVEKNPDGINENRSEELGKEMGSEGANFEKPFENHTPISVHIEIQDFDCWSGSDMVNGKGQVDVHSTDLQEESISVSKGKNSIEIADSDLHCQIKVEKHRKNSKTNGNRGCKSRSNCTDPSPKVSERLVSDKYTVTEDKKWNFGDVSATPGVDFYIVSSESEHDRISCDFTEIGGITSKQRGQEKLCVDTADSLQTEKPDRGRLICSRNVKRQHCASKCPPPLPSPRVQTTPEEVSKAFGLKTSRSGRLLVPRLAHWCNQAIAYDLDGGIIAISKGSTQKKDDNGGYFEPPKQPAAVKIQEKLCNAANEIIMMPNCGKRRTGRVPKQLVGSVKPR